MAYGSGRRAPLWSCLVFVRSTDAAARWSARCLSATVSVCCEGWRWWKWRVQPEPHKPDIEGSLFASCGKKRTTALSQMVINRMAGQQAGFAAGRAAGGGGAGLPGAASQRPQGVSNFLFMTSPPTLFLAVILFLCEQRKSIKKGPYRGHQPFHGGLSCPGHFPDLP